MNFVRKLIRNKTKVFLSGFVLSGTALYGVRKHSNSHFGHPLVLEALCILKEEKQIQDLVGVPVKVKYSARQDYRLSGKKGGLE